MNWLVKTVSRRGMTGGVCLALCLMANSGWAFSALYSFGDSLSDTGRNPAPAVSYYNGRYSNGALWVEYLATQLGLTYNPSNNLAVAGSTTADLAAEVAQVSAGPDFSGSLFTIWSGGNDFLDNATLGLNDPAWNTVIMSALQNITNAVNSLYAKGAREILVGNLPNIAQIPAANGLPPIYLSYLTSKVVSLNSLLAAGLHTVQLASPGLQIYLLDTYTLFNRCYTSPATYGFAVVTTDALDNAALTDKSFDGPGKNYLFWDSIHPTTKTHALIAAAAFQITGVQLDVRRNASGMTLLVSNLNPGSTYTIQSSTNLANWSNYQILTAASTNASLVLGNAGSGGVFYRVRY